SPLLGELRLAVHRERSLHAVTPHGVEADDNMDLPHARRALTDRARAPLRPICGTRGIPIPGGHPYSYRDSYRDGARRLPPVYPRMWSPTSDFALRARGD